MPRRADRPTRSGSPAARAGCWSRNAGFALRAGRGPAAHNPSVAGSNPARPIPRPLGTLKESTGHKVRFCLQPAAFRPIAPRAPVCPWLPVGSRTGADARRFGSATHPQRREPGGNPAPEEARLNVEHHGTPRRQRRRLPRPDEIVHDAAAVGRETADVQAVIRVLLRGAGRRHPKPLGGPGWLLSRSQPEWASQL